MGDITAYLKNEKLAIAEIPFQPQDLAELLALIEAGTISGKIAKDILPELLANGGSPQKFVESKGLIQISDTGRSMGDRCSLYRQSQGWTTAPAKLSCWAFLSAK